MKLKLFIILAILTFSINSVFAEVYKSSAEAKRIPKGTKFQIQLLEPVSTNHSTENDYFSAILLTEQKTKTSVILPSGSLIRGSISKIVPSKMLSRGAILYLDFDHIVTPKGRQLPIEMAVYATMKTTYDGGLYENLGYGEAIQDNWTKAVEITTDAVDYAMETPIGARIFAVPVCAIGAGLGGGLYFIGDGIIDLFRKGKDVVFNQGDILTVVLTNDIDVPVN